jgi:hypothetical protein
LTISSFEIYKIGQKHQIKGENVRKFLLTLVIATLFSGCFVKTRIKRTFSVSLQSETNSKKEQTKGGLIITVTPVTPSNIQDFPQANPLFDYTTVLSGRNYPRSIRQALMKFPFFKVKIRNTTQYSFRWNRTILRLKDCNGNTYKPQDKRDITTKIQDKWEEIKSGVRRRTRGEQRIIGPSRRSIRSRVSRINLINRNTEIGPEDSVKGFIAFPIPTKTNDSKGLAEWIQGCDKIKLQFYQVPVVADKVGNVSKVEKFEFRFSTKVQTHEKTIKYRSIFP